MTRFRYCVFCFLWQIFTNQWCAGIAGDGLCALSVVLGVSYKYANYMCFGIDGQIFKTGRSIKISDTLCLNINVPKQTIFIIFDPRTHKYHNLGQFLRIKTILLKPSNQILMDRHTNTPTRTILFHG